MKIFSVPKELTNTLNELYVYIYVHVVNNQSVYFSFVSMFFMFLFKIRHVVHVWPKGQQLILSMTNLFKSTLLISKKTFVYGL